LSDNLFNNRYENSKVDESSSPSSRVSQKLMTSLNRNNNTTNNINNRTGEIIENTMIQKSIINNINTINNNVSYKFNENGFIYLDKNFDITHMNLYALNNLFLLKNPFPPKKINITKIVRDFKKKLKEFEINENVLVTFDLTLLEKLLNQFMINDNNVLNNENLNNEFINDETQMSIQNTFKKKNLSINKKRNAKIFFKKINLIGTKEYYFLIKAQKTEKNENNFLLDSSNDTNSDYFMDDYMINNNNNNNKNLDNSKESYSSIDNFESDNEKTREHKIEKEKNILLNNTYFPHFFFTTNIMVYVLSFVSFVWILISYFLEFYQLKKIKNKLRIFNNIGDIINVLAYYVMNSFFFIRFNLRNSTIISNEIINLVKNNMKNDRISLFTNIEYLMSDFSINENKNFRDSFSSKIYYFNAISNNSGFYNEKFNYEEGLNKLIYYMKYITNSSNYFNASLNVMFNEEFNDFLKSKIYFVYFNYFNNFQGILEEIYDNYYYSLTDNVNKERNRISLFCVCGVVINILIVGIIFAILNFKEKNQRDYLMFLASVFYMFYEEKMKILNLFYGNLIKYLKKDQNFHNLKGKIVNDNEFKQAFIDGDIFLKKREMLNNMNNNTKKINQQKKWRK
jgi:hypothetical protein